MLAIGETVTLYDPGSPTEPESWTRGVIRETLARDSTGAYAVHVVTLNAFRWDRDGDWGPYDGVPECIARERNGDRELEWIDTWPRRNFRPPTVCPDCAL